jgi:chemotaxis protein CheZ
MTTERKLFTAELKRLKAKGEPVAVAMLAASALPASSDVLQALADIKGELRELTHLIKGEEAPAPDAATQEVDILQRKYAEVSMLKTELRALAVCIEQTKSEIAALKPADTENDRLTAVAFELDAIVNSTEGATQTILEAAEKIETITREIQSHGGDGYISRLAEDINETIVGVYEACNFQDITGQRITKVVRTLKYIEERIMAMINIWGPETIGEFLPRGQDQNSKDDDSALLNGPALENQGISQDEIDKLFG